MKWKNRGEEFLTEYQTLESKYCDKKLFIYGAGMIGGRIADAITRLTDWCVEGFFDLDEKKTTFKDKSVVRWNGLKKIVTQENVLVIIGLPEEIGIQVKDKIVEECGVGEDKCVTYSRFVQHDFPIILMYKYDKYFLDSVSMIMTEACTLRCEKCAIMLPYFKEYRTPELKQLKKEADALLSKIDFVSNYTVTGGEPLLNKELPNLLEYVGANYREKIGSFKIISNGMIKPWDTLLQVMQKYSIAVEISDYTTGVPRIKEQVEKSLETYREAGLQTYFLSSASWVDFGFDTVDNQYTEDQLIRFFDYCHTRCRGYVDGKIRYCINAFFAARAKGHDEDESNAFDILNLEPTKENLRALVEFDMGYSDNGYLEMCQHCNGTIEINTHYIEVGVQCKNL